MGGKRHASVYRLYLRFVFTDCGNQQPESQSKRDHAGGQYHDRGDPPFLTLLFIGKKSQHVGPAIEHAPHHDDASGEDRRAKRDRGVDCFFGRPSVVG